MAPKSKAAVKPAPKPTTVVANGHGVVDNRTLPKKDGELFKQLLQAYETKQFTNGLKIADQILKSHPQHGGELPPALMAASAYARGSGSELMAMPPLRCRDTRHAGTAAQLHRPQGARVRAD